MSAELTSIPAIGTLLNRPAVAELIGRYGRELVTYGLRTVVDQARAALQDGGTAASEAQVIAQAARLIRSIAEPSLKPVINATGVVLHTNLGRAVLGQRILAEISPILTGYSNVEFDLEAGKRGHRISHLSPLLRFLTGAQDVLVVNNNAAAIILILASLAKRREVIISRGELIEIGGAFRIPEIMTAAGAKMVEVGTTNRTRLADYQNAAGPQTALIFKAHTSNYTIKGFTEEVGVAELARFCHEQGLPLVYDIGSGLLRRPRGLALESEPDVAGAIAAGADLVCFSGDKLLGGPQAGIIAGRADLIARMAKHPLMRALRVGKLSLASLAAACRGYLTEQRLRADNPTFAMLEQSPQLLARRAQALQTRLAALGVASRLVPGSAQCGGGTLPELTIPSAAVMIAPEPSRAAKKVLERIFRGLMTAQRPVVGILREGGLLFDVFAVRDEELESLAQSIAAELKPATDSRM
jgi:L-seryl-tRNA(Ser) seleniumtransferase